MEKEHISDYYVFYTIYVFENLTPEEQELVKKHFIQNCQFVRVGPKGYIVHEAFKKDAANIYTMPLRSTDIFVASYQRSGTTWTQELVWLLASNLDYVTALKVPLTQRYIFLDLFQIIDLAKLDFVMKSIGADPDDQNIRNILTMMGQPVTRVLATMPSPRFIKTHLPMSLLNPKLLNSAKLVYIARDPRDVAVSCYYHTKFMKILPVARNFKDFWNMFLKGCDLPTCIHRVAKFLGKELNADQIDRLCDHLSIENFKKNKSVNLEEMKTYTKLPTPENFIRKGKTGGWRDYFDAEMAEQAEKWIKDGLSGTDLIYPYINC